MEISYNYYPEGKKKALTMSYDDGNNADRRLIGIFNKYGIKGTFHLNSGFFGKTQYIEEKEVTELYKGHEISVHSVSHPFLQNVPFERVVEEISSDRKKLEKLAGYVVSGMSYPFGTYNEDIVKMLHYLGIEYSRTVASHNSFNLPENFLTWHPTCHHKGNIIDQGKRFMELNEYNKLPLFYVWGHSYEFNDEDNWNLIEEFCQFISGKEDIWYATNIDICHYAKALKQLRFSADLTMVYNPSALSVWIGVNNQPVEIQGGKTTALD